MEDQHSVPRDVHRYVAESAKLKQPNPYAATEQSSADEGGYAAWLNSRAGTLISFLICALPFISYAYAWFFRVLASAVLGQWARPNIHDPADFLYGVPYILGTLMFLLSFAVAPVVLIVGYRRAKLLKHMFAYGFSVLATIVLFRLDIAEITSWLAD